MFLFCCYSIAFHASDRIIFPWNSVVCANIIFFLCLVFLRLWHLGRSSDSASQRDHRVSHKGDLDTKGIQTQYFISVIKASEAISLRCSQPWGQWVLHIYYAEFIWMVQTLHRSQESVVLRNGINSWGLHKATTRVHVPVKEAYKDCHMFIIWCVCVRK